MKNYWLLETHGDPLVALRRFVLEIWQQAKLDYMLLPLKQDDQPCWEPTMTDDPTRIKDFNPFIPWMSQNIAKEIPNLLKEHSNAKIGLFLRPCEIQTLQKMGKLNGLNLAQAITLSIDCLGTYPLEDFQWRYERKTSQEKFTKEAWQFSRQGGISAYRYRTACQVCVNALAKHADINIGVIGLPVRQSMLVNALPEIHEEVNLTALVGEYAAQGLIQQRVKTGNILSHRHKSVYARTADLLGDTLPGDMQTLIDFFESCGECQKCMEACPICAVQFPQRDGHGRYNQEDILLWLNACAGCGMCEGNCPLHKPVSLIFSKVREKLTTERPSSF